MVVSTICHADTNHLLGDCGKVYIQNSEDCPKSGAILQVQASFLFELQVMNGLNEHTFSFRNIVDEALFGKDPDVAEDVSDPKASIEVISRQRQRNEICITLKRSSIIYR